MKNLVFIDVDGTLVNYETEIPPGVDKVIRDSRKKGNKILFCTGRSKAEVYPELWDIGFDGMIGGNGSYIEFEGKEIFHETLSKDECKEIVDWLKDNNLEFYLESNSGLYASKNFEQVGQPVIEAYMENKGDEPKSIREVFPDMIFNSELVRDDVNKISFVLNSYDDYLKAKEQFPNFKVGTWGGIGNKALFGDIALKDINKGKAIKKLIDCLQFNPMNTIAFGDAPVDVPMFKAVNIGVAMGNSPFEVKQEADFITDDVNENGLINAFRALGLS